jgi:hypothetical protein
VSVTMEIEQTTNDLGRKDQRLIPA